MIGSLLIRVLVIAVVWIAATEGAPGAWVYGAVAVPLVVAATYLLTGWPVRSSSVPPLRRAGARALSRAGATVSLIGWIAVRAIGGGLDVARRAVALPRPDVAPGWRTYRTTLTTRGGRVAFALVMNLLPGTLSARLEGDELEVHVIAGDLDTPAQLRRLEERIARIERA